MSAYLYNSRLPRQLCWGLMLLGEQTKVHVGLYTDITRQCFLINESGLISHYATFKTRKFWFHTYDTKNSLFYSTDYIELQLKPDIGLKVNNEG